MAIFVLLPECHWKKLFSEKFLAFPLNLLSPNRKTFCFYCYENFHHCPLSCILQQELLFLTGRLKSESLHSTYSNRWKFSLRVWLVEYYSKNTKSWKKFTKGASIKRREDVTSFFNQLVVKHNVAVDVLMLQQKSEKK